jgi:tight adherence protein B
LESVLLSAGLVQFAAVALAGLAAGGIVYVIAFPYFSGERKVEKRLANVAGGGQARRNGALAPQPLQTRRKQVQDSIKEMEAKQKAKRRISLRIKLERAGLRIKPRTYYLLSVISGLVGFLLGVLTGSSLLVSLLLAFACGFGLPRWLVARQAKRRQAKFLTEFANAIDIIVRGIKSGLPLNDCLQVIAAESPEPVRSEFIELVEQQKVGVHLSRAFERMFDRTPLQEVNFFAIVIAIQAQTGGNLAEALTNLSQVLRDRYRLQAKIKAFSAEAKASAVIIGALPPCVMAIVYLTTPDYISLLWSNKLGNLMLMASGIWMLIGLIVMRKMINFDY